MWVQKCDICGEEKEIKRFRYKIKIKKEAPSWDDFWWRKLDICDDCQEIIIDVIKHWKGRKNR